VLGDRADVGEGAYADARVGEDIGALTERAPGVEGDDGDKGGNISVLLISVTGCLAGAS
jgi:hypothetical protein